jgi:U3 small nucleolar RNA-associated protein 4
LFITLANNEFHVYDIENYSFTNWSGYASSLTPKQLSNLQDSVLGIATHPDNDNIILLWGSSFICRILLDRILACAPPSRQNKKRARAIVHETDHDTTMVNGKESKQNFAMVTRYQSLLYVGMLDAHQVVAVERPIFHIMQALPSAFYAPRFGT